MHVHGKLDRTVPYDGGKSVTLAGANYVSAADSVRFWVMADGCSPKPRTTQITNVQRDVYTECRGGTTVELVTISNLSHGWPTALRIDPRKATQGPADVVWDFFAVQARQ